MKGSVTEGTSIFHLLQNQGPSWKRGQKIGRDRQQARPVFWTWQDSRAHEILEAGVFCSTLEQEDWSSQWTFYHGVCVGWGCEPSFLTEELWTVDDFLGKNSQFSLRAWPSEVNHPPVDGPTPRKIWATQFGLHVLLKKDDMKMLGGGGEMWLDLGGVREDWAFYKFKVYCVKFSNNKSILSFKNKTNEEGLAYNLNCEGQQCWLCLDAKRRLIKLPVFPISCSAMLFTHCRLSWL